MICIWRLSREIHYVYKSNSTVALGWTNWRTNRFLSQYKMKKKDKKSVLRLVARWGFNSWRRQLHPHRLRSSSTGYCRLRSAPELERPDCEPRYLAPSVFKSRGNFSLTLNCLSLSYDKYKGMFHFSACQMSLVKQ
jgi:hypothetical protein